MGQKPGKYIKRISFSLFNAGFKQNEFVVAFTLRTQDTEEIKFRTGPFLLKEYYILINIQIYIYTFTPRNSSVHPLN